MPIENSQSKMKEFPPQLQEYVAYLQALARDHLRHHAGDKQCLKGWWYAGDEYREVIEWLQSLGQDVHEFPGRKLDSSTIHEDAHEWKIVNSQRKQKMYWEIKDNSTVIWKSTPLESWFHCAKCKERLGWQDNFCRMCGAKLDWTNADFGNPTLTGVNHPS